MSSEAARAFAEAFAKIEKDLITRVYWGWPPLVAFADCLRCGAPAHPIRGYCGRYCEECDAYDCERRLFGQVFCRRPGYNVRIWL